MKTPDLVFDWPHRHRIHLLLPAAILAAGAAHLAVLFVFSVAYPRPESEGPKPARLFFVPPGDPAMAPLAGFLASSDPALFAPGRGLPRTDAISNADHTPQFESSRPELITALPSILREKPAGPVFAGPPEIPRPQRQQPPPAPPLPTRIIAETPLATRLPQPLECPIPAPTHQTHDLVFLAGVEPDGTVRYLFAESAGATGESLESAAAEFLRGVRFTPSASQQTEWGFVRFRWGTPPPPAIPE